MLFFPYMKESIAILEILISEFKTKLGQLEGIVPREVKFFDAPGKINVAIGMRRVGKTYCLYEKIQKLLAKGIPLSRILYINFEDDRLLPLSQQKLGELLDAFYSIYPENHDSQCFFFLDEIQNAEGWPTVIRRFHNTKKIEFFLTGSSAKLLSKEIASNLRGRSLATEIWPYSFTEFLTASEIPRPEKPFGNKEIDVLRAAFLNYLSIGGFPEVTFYKQSERIATLQEYVDIAIFRDIVERHTVKNPTVVKHMILSMLHNASGLFSINKFYNELKNKGYKIGKDILYEYMEIIEDAYMLFAISAYDGASSAPKKVYAIDSGLIRATTLDFTSDLGKLFENLIYLDLRRQGCKVSYYTTEEGYGIDFVAEYPDGSIKLIQAAFETENEETMERERRALESGMKELSAPGEIVTLESYLRSI